MNDPRLVSASNRQPELGPWIVRVNQNAQFKMMIRDLIAGAKLARQFFGTIRPPTATFFRRRRDSA